MYEKVLSYKQFLPEEDFCRSILASMMISPLKDVFDHLNMHIRPF